ncbi:MAG TPA: hypothetical protein GX738_05525 [Firmicutes bacterium]|nr:hypothetical protein [Bacillota bacterium]
MPERSAFKSAVFRSLPSFSGSLIAWFLNSYVGVRWFAMNGVGIFCSEIYPLLDHSKARLLSIVYAIVAVVYVVVELVLRNYIWAFAGLALHGYLLFKMWTAQSHINSSR